MFLERIPKLICNSALFGILRKITVKTKTSLSGFVLMVTGIAIVKMHTQHTHPLFVKSQQRKHWNHVKNTFKVNYKNNNGL